MATTYSYACKDYPGMEACPAKVIAETEDEVMKLIEVHAAVAHDEVPGEWSEEDRKYLKSFIKPE